MGGEGKAMRNTKCYVHIEDSVMPQLITTAWEAYHNHDHPGRRRRKQTEGLGVETFGLLWGHAIDRKDE